MNLKIFITAGMALSIAGCASLETVALEALEERLATKLAESESLKVDEMSCGWIDLRIEKNLAVIQRARADFEDLDLWLEYIGNQALLFVDTKENGASPFEAAKALEDLYKQRAGLDC